MGNLSMPNDSINLRYYWAQTYNLLGTYTFTIWANDSSDNWACASDTFVIQDTTPPTIIDVTVIPDPQEVFYDVNISADITDNYQLCGVWVEIFNPDGVFVGNLSMLNDSINLRYYWAQNYNLLGTYTFTIWAYDTSDNWALASDTFIIQDTTPPMIIEVEALPDPQEVFGNVNISANVTDNYKLFGVWVEIYDPNESFIGNFSMLYDSLNCRFYWNQSYDIIGTYMFTIWANDTSGNWMYASDTFVIQDTTPPIIIDITAIPHLQEVFKAVNISANITDNYELFGVWIEVYYSDGNPVGNFSMLNDPDTSKYYFNQTYGIVGIYNFTIWANDSSNNWAFSSGSFVVEPQPEPRESNWKPIIALIFTIILLIVGILISYNRPIRFTGILEKDRWYTFLLGVLPYVIAEVITGIISFFTGLLNVPPILGIGMIVDLIILIAGIISFLMIYKKGKITPGIKDDNRPMPSTQSEEALSPPPEKPEDKVSSLGDELPPPPPPSY
jgi:hypothetical protein